MKHAVIILAHKDFTYLQHLIAYFSRDCCVFVHIDKQSSMTREQRDSLSRLPQVAGVYSRYAVHWGGFSIIIRTTGYKTAENRMRFCTGFWTFSGGGISDGAYLPILSTCMATRSGFPSRAMQRRC